MTKKSDKKEEWTEIGEVGVDSGQVMIADPCYIENEWQEATEEELELLWKRRHVNSNGEHFDYGKDFSNYNEDVDGDTPNNHIKSGNWTEVDVPTPELEGRFSYGGCCKATLSNKQHGQLNYKMGHAGAGVVATSGYGDGVYPVYARYEDGRVAELRIKFLPHPYDEIGD